MRRRNFCTALSAGAVGAIADARATGHHRPVVTTAGQFDIDWGGPHRVEGVGPFDYETNGHVPGIDTTGATDVTIFVPGFRSDGTAVSAIRTALSQHGSDGSVVAYAWDPGTALWEWEETAAIAHWNGPMLAAVTRDILDAAPDTTVRYVAHSVGAAVALSALSTLGDWGHRQPVTAVSLLGAGVSRDRFSTGEGFASAIESQVDQLDNYWSRTDEVLDWAFPDGTGDTALGSAGLDRAGPELYTDHLVDIETHGAYVDAEQGCLGAVVDAW